MNTLKKCWPDVLVIVLFAAISFAYFFVPVTQGKILYRHDSSAGRGAGQEVAEYREQTGETSRWTNALFGGMPTYQTSPSYQSTNALSKVMDAYHLWLPENVWYLFVYLLGFYIMLRAFDFRQALAALGSVIWAFSSYFLIIIAAGHIWKVMALAYLPPMIAGVVLSYKGKYMWGFLLTAIFTAFEVKANHVQMTYYYLFIVFFLVIAYLVQAIREKQLARFFKASAVCAVAALIGVAINISNLYHTWEYQNETMRGKSELVKKNTANQTSSGLERDYITQWSYGIGETWTLLVPNTKGGASVPMIYDKTVQKEGDPMYEPIYQQLGQYWGEQPMTSGPVYVGAFVLMLFILSLFVVKGPVKWALLAATILSVLLSWGRNFMWFTDLFIDYMPMYAKFRTVASILVIAEFTIPLLAILGLRECVKVVEGEKAQSVQNNQNTQSTPNTPSLLTMKQLKRYTLISFLLTAGIAALFALMPGVFFDFVSSAERQALSQIPADQLNPLLDNLTTIRKHIFTADCWRTVFVIVLGTVFLFLYFMKKLKAEYMAVALFVLCLVDLWQVDKRYLNDAMFVPKSEREAPIEMTKADEIILKDKSLDYRVLNFASNTFNENETSFYHKSIGGYHAAKLRRYQELIEAHIVPEMQKTMQAVAEAGGNMEAVAGDSIYPVLNMLNTKYFIMPLQGGETVPLLNPYAYGNAWMVDKVTFVDNANDELEALGKINLRHEAVADKKFMESLSLTPAPSPKGEGSSQSSQDAQSNQNTPNTQSNPNTQNTPNVIGTVVLKQYAPNQLTYQVDAEKDGVIVFSEIYYPGWTATDNGQEVELGRVDYVLRALPVKAGKHQIVLTFQPKSITITETIAYVAFGILILAILIVAFLTWKKKKG